ncbi:MAG: VOC family protein [Anaerolineae bacterium]|nr:VOC family protein [Anaerolineae bacterium]
MTLRFDHAVVCVVNLEEAIEDFRGLGFNPITGGTHAGGKTHNALIVFRDGTYLELLAPTSPDLLTDLDPADRSSFLFLFAEGEGFRGYALVSDDLEADTIAMQARGISVELQPPNGRARPDGVQLRWRSAYLNEQSGTMTPFFLQDLTPRNLRVPDEPTITTHPNGASGIWEVTIQMSNAVGDFHAQLFGVEGQPAFFDPPIVRQRWTHYDLAGGTRMMVCTETDGSTNQAITERQIISLGISTDQVEGGTLESHRANLLLTPLPLVEQITRRPRHT